MKKVINGNGVKVSIGDVDITNDEIAIDHIRIDGGEGHEHTFTCEARLQRIDLFNEIINGEREVRRTNKKLHKFHVGSYAFRELEQECSNLMSSHPNQTYTHIMGYPVLEDKCVHDDLILGIDKFGNILFTIKVDK